MSISHIHAFSNNYKYTKWKLTITYNIILYLISWPAPVLIIPVAQFLFTGLVSHLLDTCLSDFNHPLRCEIRPLKLI